MSGRDVESWYYRPGNTFYVSIPDLIWRGTRLREPTGRAQTRVRKTSHWRGCEVVRKRVKLPLPTTFPLHQWAKTYMGMPPAGYVHGHAWYATESYGVVDAAKVMNWEPIVSIGLRGWRPTPEYLRASDLSGRGRGRGQGRGRGRVRSRRGRSAPKPEGVGEPLFANNVHVWSFGTSE